MVLVAMARGKSAKDAMTWERILKDGGLVTVLGNELLCSS
jgi:hypothetical protein